MKKSFRNIVPALLIFGVMCGNASAKDYPDHPITLVVPWSVGGSTDVLARAAVKQLSEELGQTIVVENRAGASGMVGACEVVRAKPDGYTLVFNTNSTYAIVPHLYKNFPCDFQNGLIPVGLVATNQQVLTISSSLGVNNLKSFIDYLKKEPGKVAFGSAGVGGTSHLAMEQLMSMSGTSMLHVPYKGGSDSLQALLGNQIQAVFVDVSSAIPVLDSGRVVGLGTSSKEPVPALKSIKPINQLGLPDFDSYTSFGLFAPAKTPQPVIDKLNHALNVALKADSLKSLLLRNGYKPGGGSSQDLSKMMKTESQHWGELIEQRNIKLE